MTYDKISHLHTSFRQRMDGTPFISFIAPLVKGQYENFMTKIESIQNISKVDLNEILDNPETVRNVLDQVADEDLEIYVKSTKEEDNFLGTIDEYRQKYNIGTIEASGYMANSDQ